MPCCKVGHGDQKVCLARTRLPSPHPQLPSPHSQLPSPRPQIRSPHSQLALPRVKVGWSSRHLPWWSHHGAAADTAAMSGDQRRAFGVCVRSQASAGQVRRLASALRCGLLKVVQGDGRERQLRGRVRQPTCRAAPARRRLRHARRQTLAARLSIGLVRLHPQPGAKQLAGPTSLTPDIGQQITSQLQRQRLQGRGVSQQL